MTPKFEIGDRAYLPIKIVSINIVGAKNTIAI